MGRARAQSRRELTKEGPCRETGGVCREADGADDALREAKLGSSKVFPKQHKHRDFLVQQSPPDFNQERDRNTV